MKISTIVRVGCFGALFLSLGALGAGTNELHSVSADAWKAFEPPPDSKYDWIQLDSGEWLKGDLKVMYDQSLEFDSDKMDDQSFDF